jgi:hypothetical protein
VGGKGSAAVGGNLSEPLGCAGLRAEEDGDPGPDVVGVRLRLVLLLRGERTWLRLWLGRGGAAQRRSRRARRGRW